MSAAFGFFVIWFKSPKGMTQYKHTLSAITLATSGFDLIINFVLRPVALFPLWGGFSDSALARLTGKLMGAVGLLDGDVTYLVPLAQLLCYVALSQLVLSFFFRYFALQSDSWFLQSVPRMYAMGAVFHMGTAFPSAICLTLARSPRHKMIEYILQKRPEFSALINHTQWVIYDPEIDAEHDRSLLFSYVSFGTICAYVITGATCVVLIVRTMNRMREHMSEKTYKLHKNLLIALCWQSAIPLVMYFAPLFFGLIVIYLHLERNVRGGMHVLCAIMGLHSTINVILMTYFTTPYRQFAVDLLYQTGVLKKSPTTVGTNQVSTSVSSALT